MLSCPLEFYDILDILEFILSETHFKAHTEVHENKKQIEEGGKKLIVESLKLQLFFIAPEDLFTLMNYCFGSI